MAKYTQGEWKVAENTGVIVCNGEMVAKVNLPPGKPEMNAQDIKDAISERQANACLIVAAPQMYETLKALYEPLRTGYIANDCIAADRLRLKLENRVKAVLAAIDGGNRNG
jgi:hypothetical protein